MDGSDFLMWQRGLGKSIAAQRSDGDANADGKVDAADLAVWEANFVASSSVAASVPEPASFAIVGFALACLTIIQRRSRIDPFPLGEVVANAIADASNRPLPLVVLQGAS